MEILSNHLSPEGPFDGLRGTDDINVPEARGDLSKIYRPGSPVKTQSRVLKHVSPIPSAWPRLTVVDAMAQAEEAPLRAEIARVVESGQNVRTEPGHNGTTVM